MNMHDLNVRVIFEPGWGQYGLYLYHGQDGKPDSVLELVQITKVEEGQEIKPFTRILPVTAQRLIDDLWNSGLRPSDGTGNAGQLGSVQAHLNDMRAIAEKFLKVELP